MDTVIAILIGIALGMAVHIILGVLFAPLVGMCNAIIPASVIGMDGGMFLGMRDWKLPVAIVVGAI
jgi:hypothetical protein